MRRTDREITDAEKNHTKSIQTCHCCRLGFCDNGAVYIVPLNFGYDWEDKLVFYFHCAHEGYKLDLLHQNPHVCVNASSFISYAGASVKGHLHDYRSVTARGVAERLEPDSAEFIHAHEQLLSHNLRDKSQVHTTAMKFIELWKITCEDVTAKAEITPKTPEGVAYAPAKGDGMPLDESHILDMQKERNNISKRVGGFRRSVFCALAPYVLNML